MKLVRAVPVFSLYEVFRNEKVAFKTLNSAFLPKKNKLNIDIQN